MNRSATNSRLSLLVIGMLVLAGAILWSAFASWRAGREIRARFERVRVEGARTTSHLRDAVLEMRSNLSMSEVTGEQTDWRDFQDHGEQLRAWLSSTRDLAVTPAEKAVFDKIDAAFSAYLAEATKIHSSRRDDESKPDLIQRLSRIESASDPLLTLGSELATTRRLALTQFVTESEQSIGWLQQMISLSLLALVGFAVWSARVIYREMISPLQVRLIETTELAERQEKLASLGILAAGVAHEIRNPLTAIKARLYTQQKALPTGSPAHNDATFIGKEIDRLARITSEFLAFARPSDPTLQSMPAATLLDEVRDLLAPQLTEDSIRVVVEPAPALQVNGDPHQLQQVLINLVQNAAESIGSNGTISLRARSGEFALNGKAHDVAILEVEDTGKGIPPDVQARLFDPFFTTKASGAGLGLSIAARIIEKHGGAIQYQTRVDHGTTFGIILPLHTV